MVVIKCKDVKKCSPTVKTGIYFSIDGEFTTFNKTIRQLVYPPEFCITIVFNFYRALQSSQEKSKTMVMQSFRG